MRAVPLVPSMRLIAPLMSMLALCVAGCSREPRNEFLVRFECKFDELREPLPVVIDLERMRMAIHTSSDSSYSVPLRNVGGELVFENDPRNDQSPRLRIRADGHAQFRTRLQREARATEISGSCQRGG